MQMAEFCEWQVIYEEYDRFGHGWLQTGILAATTVNLWSKRKRRPDYFMPFKITKTPDQIGAGLTSYFHAKKIASRQRP